MAGHTVFESTAGTRADLQKGMANLQNLDLSRGRETILLKVLRSSHCVQVLRYLPYIVHYSNIEMKVSLVEEQCTRQFILALLELKYQCELPGTLCGIFFKKEYTKSRIIFGEQSPAQGFCVRTAWDSF